MSLPGLPEMLIIFAVIVLLFGVNKLPKLGGAIGESIKNFKKGVRDTDPDGPKTIASDKDNDGHGGGANRA